ncbi:cytoskeletal protein CcmA (bactofilin family) [Mangrovibacter plantisponsor]|uniref:Cytoskeletal protein CcmA (Bactofilin family) n=2 Tax=Enterobacteriaceae TaxID=543 RepID=A0A317Q2Q9_9ENTR|nr:cytoskeletal protein CcmA (bactofilin family) [Mangrovibacter plantisponsor]
MFGKKKSQQEVHLPVLEKNSGSPHGTVIAQGVCFDGNITASGQVYIYGTVTGNIYAREGKISVMHNGSVTGNVESQSLIVDGSVHGESCAEHVEICENGRVEGRLRYSTLSIVQGGVLAGDMAHNSDCPTANIVDFSSEQDIAKEV